MNDKHRAKISKALKKFNKENPGCKLGPKNPKWRGGVMGDGHGRKYIYCPGHPNPSFGKSHVYEYRLVMEKILGRYLTKDEIVHHIDGDHSNNTPENLQVMSQKEHASLHSTKYNGKEVLSSFLNNGADKACIKFSCSKKTLYRLLRAQGHYVRSRRVVK